MFPSTAHFYDGLTARRHDVEISLAENRMGLVLSGQTLSQTYHWPLQDLRAEGGRADEVLTVMRHEDTGDETTWSPARLIMSDPEVIAWIRRTRPALYKKDVHKGSYRKVAKFAGLAIAAAALMLFVILPAMAGVLAKIIPLDREIAFGKTVVYQMERFLGGSRINDLTCDNQDGRAALDKMLAALTDPQNMAYDINLSVFDHDMVNAFAAPGGQVVIVRGLLDTATGPDQVAGVLAHELGHVENRDSTRNALRAAGSAGLLTMMIGDFTGGAAIALLGEQLITSSYTRDAETKADQFAFKMLTDANISAGGMARFFAYVQDLEGDFQLPPYLASHPNSADREARAQAIADTQSTTIPVLDKTEWAALKSICSDK